MDGLYQWDMATFRAINLGYRSAALDALFLVLSVTGLGGLEALFAIFLYPWPALRRLIVPLIATVAFSGFVLADGLKPLVHRDRPSFLGLAVVQENVHKNSFPSGHTTTAFAFATMLLLLTLGTKQVRWGYFALLWAVGVAFSRVYRGVHWPTDVFAGACLGAIGSALVYGLFARQGWLDLTLGTEDRGQGTEP